MSKGPIVLSLVVLALAVIYVEVRRPGVEAGKGQPDGTVQDLRDLGRRLDAQEARLSALEARFRDSGSEGAVGRKPVELSATLEEEIPPVVEEPVIRDAENPAEKKAAEILEKVAAGRATTADIDALWELLLGGGKGVIDQAIAAFKKRVQEDPENADAHYGLGLALTAKFLSGKMSQMEVAALSVRADAEFSKTLALDDHHFGARYAKAKSYTYWPPNLGKGPEAIRNFEVLVKQHGGDPTIRQMEDVYYNLGKEYAKLGNLEKAKQWYREGLRVFPDAKAMRAELEAMEK